jgi:pyrimidine-specific ribonucleoside hydrolase
MKRPIHFDMETQDPDDVMTLAILATHPRVELTGITITPGGRDQIGLVKHALNILGINNIPIGGDPLREKPSVSIFHEKWLGKFQPSDSTLEKNDIIEKSVRAGATLLTGAPLKNFASLPSFPRWVAQGGFAGDLIVPVQYRLPKFAGKETCATFNFGGAPKIAEAMLASSNIQEKLLVGKNVCHGVAWNQTFHERVKALPKRTAGMDLVLQGMELYLQKNPDGKKLHDPLAMAVAIDKSVCEFRSVEMYRQKGEWGARLKDDSDTQIAISYDAQRFFDVITEVTND